MRRGFTLIELLVVIAIIAILAAILFPVFARAREKARQTSCLANVKQINLGMMMYVQDYDEVTPIYRFSSSSSPRLFWYQSLTPYLKNTQILRCPSRPNVSGSCLYGYYYAIDIWSIGAIEEPSAIAWLMDSCNCLAHYPTTTAADFDAFLAGMNESGVPRAPHNDGLILGFVDGHAKWSSAQAAWDNGSTYWPWP